jgi:hypothetical protein
LQLLPHHSLSAGSVCCQGAFCSQGHFTVSCSLQKNIPYIKLGLVTKKFSLINPKKSTMTKRNYEYKKFTQTYVAKYIS